MNGSAAFGSPTGSSGSSTESVQADAALAGYSHSLGGELALSPAHARRDDVGLDGRRPTELEPTEAAA